MMLIRPYSLTKYHNKESKTNLEVKGKRKYTETDLHGGRSTCGGCFFTIHHIWDISLCLWRTYRDLCVFSNAPILSGSWDHTDDLVISVQPNPSIQGLAASPSKNKHDDVQGQGAIFYVEKDAAADKMKKRLQQMNQSNKKPAVDHGFLFLAPLAKVKWRSEMDWKEEWDDDCRLMLLVVSLAVMMVAVGFCIGMVW